MTTGTNIHFHVSRSAAFRDAAIVAFLALVLGAFLAQVASAPRHASSTRIPIVSASLNADANG
jgi:hypothetical protein